MGLISQSAEPMKSAKVQSKKKVVTSDQDDESLVDLTGSEPVVVVHRPGRQTKQQALKKMVMVDSESEEDADESDFGDDESD